MRGFAVSYCLRAIFLLVAIAALVGPVRAQQGSVVASSAGRNASATSPETKFDVPDTTRRAIVFTKYALDVRIETRDASLHARAIVTVKNDGTTALDAIPLQISSSLKWEGIDAEGKPLRFVHHTVATDADHTGAMNEALVTPASPLAPGGEQTLTVFYSGAVAPAATRLTAIGTPPDVAGHMDWDGIRDEFTGLRGFGNVLWYPVSSVPVALGESDRYFREIGLTKLRDLPDAPSALDLVSDPENKQVMALILMRQEAGRPFAAPPGTPADRVAALRQAFQETLRDPGFVAEAEKMQLEIDPMSGQAIVQMLIKAYAGPKRIVQRAAALVRPVAH